RSQQRNGPDEHCRPRRNERAVAPNTRVRQAAQPRNAELAEYPLNVALIDPPADEAVLFLRCTNRPRVPDRAAVEHGKTFSLVLGTDVAPDEIDPALITRAV